MDNTAGIIKALIIVDPQVDFFPGGPLGVLHGDEILSPVNNIVAYALKMGWPILFSRDWHPAKTTHFKEFGGNWPVHCVANTPGAAFHPDLKIPESAIIISKGMSDTSDEYSPFAGTDSSGNSLDSVLKNLGVTTLYVAGLATDYCVKACVFDAQELGYDTIILSDAVRAVNIHPTDGYEAMLQMRALFAHVTTTQEVIYEKI